MRLNLYWRGRDVIDIELHAWRRRDDGQPQDGAPNLEASGGGHAERAATYGDPATIASFGFGPTRMTTHTRRGSRADETTREETTT